MYLKEIPRKSLSAKVVLLQSTSDKLKLFVQDSIKASLNCTIDHIYRIESKKDLKEAHLLSVIQPFGAEKWLFLTNLDKIPIKDFIKTATQSSTALFLCTTDKYFNYKQVKQGMKDVEGLEELYLNYLKRVDVLTLYQNYVQQDNKLSDNLYSFVLKTYSSDIESMFILFEALQEGDILDNRKKITDLCGRGKNTTDHLMLSILTSNPKTDKGLATIVRKKVQVGIDINEDLPWGTMWNFSRGFVKSAYQIKELLIAGAIYKSVTDLPNGYDPAKLTRLNRYIWTIKEIPMSKFLRLISVLNEKKWESSLDYVRFINEYYKLDLVSRMKGDK